MRPTVTNESKATDKNGYYTHDIAYTSDAPKFGVQVLTCEYKSPSIPGSLTTGQLVSVMPPVDLTAQPPDIFHEAALQWLEERNPSISINSSGIRFVAWERMTHLFGFTGLIGIIGGGTPTPINVPPSNLSEIMIGSTFPNGLWVVNLHKNVGTLYQIGPVADNTFRWLRNPSISGHPKSILTNTTSAGSDRDPDAVDLAYWEQYGPGSTNALNNFLAAENSEPAGGGQGQWNPIPLSLRRTIGRKATWSQRSFATIDAGPTYLTPTQLKTNEQFGLSWVFGNGTNADATPDISTFQNPLVGSYYSTKGTYASVQDGNFYREEVHTVDTSRLLMLWGDVFVQDTSDALPWRQAMLHYSVDTLGFSDHNAMRDSIFRTEVFDFPPGAQLRYFRAMYTSDSMQFGVNIDTSLHLLYRVELVSDTGATPIETFGFDPLSLTYSAPSYVTVTNAGGVSRDVYIRVRALNVSGINDSDAYCEFNDVTRDTAVQCDSTASYSLKPAHGLGSYAKATQLEVAPPVPNPYNGMGDLSFQIRMTPGLEVQATVMNELGEQMLKPVMVTSSGYWQGMSCQAELPAGHYFLNVRSGGQMSTVPFVVTR